MRAWSVILALMLQAPYSSAQTNTPAHAVEIYRVTKSYRTAETVSDGSSSNSIGNDTLVERLVAIRDDGVELAYDLDPSATAKDRSRDWQLPARVFRPSTGPMVLIDADALETRLARWLKAAKWDRTMCGRWIFTWNAFQIDCDPQAVLTRLAAFDLRFPNIRDGATYHDADALRPGVVGRAAGEADGAAYATVMAVDPVPIQRTRAESDVVVGKLTGKPIAFDAALALRERDLTTGTISSTWHLAPDGNVRKRVRLTKLEVVRPDGTVERRTATETLERVLL